jgi:bacterioferritin
MLKASNAQTKTGGCFVKGNDKLIGVLNQLLADELGAISQYMVHAEMCENWGFGGLHAAIEKQAMDEMHHAEWLIARILFLDGKPVVTELSPIVIGQSALDMITNDQDAELGAVKAYNAGIALASDLGDESTADLLIEILKMEEGHVRWAEQQRAQIDQMGLENYLAQQAGEG